MLYTKYNEIFVEYNQQDATFHNLFISVRRSMCFRHSSIHHELKTAHTPSGLTNTWRCMCSFELMMDGKNVWNMYSALQK